MKGEDWWESSILLETLFRLKRVLNYERLIYLNMEYDLSYSTFQYIVECLCIYKRSFSIHLWTPEIT